MKMNRTVTIMLAMVVLIVASGLVAGCGSGPQRKYYTLAYAIDDNPANFERAPLYPISIRVKRFTIGEPYNRPQLVYRQSPFEFMYYGFRYWAAKPQKLLRDIIKEHIQSQNIVNSIYLEYTDKVPDYELGGNIESIEEFDSGGDWYAHLALRLELTRFSDKTVVWRYSFDRKKKVEQKNPVFVVKAMSELLKEEMAVVAAQIDAALAGERGSKPTLTCPAPPVDEIPVLETFPKQPDKLLREERPEVK